MRVRRRRDRRSRPDPPRHVAFDRPLLRKPRTSDGAIRRQRGRRAVAIRRRTLVIGVPANARVMPWVAFVADFDWFPDVCKGRCCFAFRATTVALVTRECARKAIAAGKATETERPEHAKYRRGQPTGTASVRKPGTG